MVRIDNLGEQGHAQYPGFARLVLLAELDNRGDRLHEGTFNLQSIQHHIRCPYRPSDEHAVCYEGFLHGLSPKFVRTMCE